MRKKTPTHSFATGPVMADPFISPLGLTMTPALSCRKYFSVDVSGVRMIKTDLEIEENTISPTPCFTLANNYCWHSWERKRKKIVNLTHKKNECEKHTYSSSSAQVSLSSRTQLPYHQHQHPATYSTVLQTHKARL